jgi:hypothetical protein
MRRLMFSVGIATCFWITTSLGYCLDNREAPIVALDTKADISAVFAFRSYDAGAVPRVSLILCVDPLQETAVGPNWSPFDPEILYELKIDNNNDGVEDIVFQFRFTPEQRLPNFYQAYVGAGLGVVAPSNSPPPIAPGTVVVPPRILNFDDAGFGQRQRYTVTMVKGGVATPITGSGPFYAVPPNVGPRTLDYAALFNAAAYTTFVPNVKVFAGTVDDPSFGDLGAFYDSFNLRPAIAPGVLSPAQDAANANITSDTLSGLAVNAIAVELPVSMLTRTGAVEPATSTAATIGVWGSTSRARLTTRRAPLPPVNSGSWSQIQRMGNPLINALLIATASKDKFSMDQPKNDSQFAAFILDPTFARVLNALAAGAVTIPIPPRTDLLPLVTYAPPIAAAGTPPGPVADILRLNTGVPPTPIAGVGFSRLGLLGGDPSGYPNGRRVVDDVTDITMRLLLGVLNPTFNKAPNNAFGDGVNINDLPFRTTFPYLADSPSGRDRRRIDPGEPGCTAGAGFPCVP